MSNITEGNMVDAATLQAEYEAARQGAILIEQGDCGRLRAKGRDRIDLLHRMSTNDLNSMEPGDARPTVLTTAIGRIIDLVWVLQGAESALLVTSPGTGETVRDWLGRHIFFQDEVALQDESTELGQFSLYGPDSGRVAEQLVKDASGLEPNHCVQDGETMVLRSVPLAGSGYTVIAPGDQIDGLRAQALGQGAVAGSGAVYEILRIEAGQPGAGHELTEDYIPLEANLWSAVSFTKGCYIGQEIIARMESRGRLAKKMVGLLAEEPVPLGAEVRFEGDRIGTVTSAAVSPWAGPIALAFVKPASVDREGRVEVSVNGVKAEAADFPLT